MAKKSTLENLSEFSVNAFRWLVKLAFLVGGLSIIFTGLFGGIYLSAYPFHSDPCDGLVGRPFLKENACYFVGYKSTAELIDIFASCKLC